MNIELRRGDTCTLEITLLTQDGEPFIPTNEIIEFSVGFCKSKPIFTCKVENGIAQITHEQTKNMEYGKYRYDVRVYTEDKKLVATPLFGVFNITEVVNNAI